MYHSCQHLGGNSSSSQHPLTLCRCHRFHCIFPRLISSIFRTTSAVAVVILGCLVLLDPCDVGWRDILLRRITRYWLSMHERLV
jgi:hypothetical protein